MEGHFQSVSASSIDARVSFIRKTYAHLMGAIIAFVALEFVLFQVLPVESMAMAMTGGYTWLIVLGVFMAVGYFANRLAMSETSVGLQYAGLALYTVMEAIIFVPLLFVATTYSSPEVLPMAAITTLTIFAGLTVAVFMTKKDFSFMRTGLTMATFLAIGVIVASILFGFQLGIIFSVIMAALAGGYVLYYTSNVLHHYNPNQHVAASLALFSAIALLFWYILRIFMFARD